MTEKIDARQQVSLAQAFGERHKDIVNRASALFPIRLRPDTDVVVVFLNYWKLKNKIENVVANLRIYDGSGRLALRQSFRVELDHTEVSIRELLNASHSSTAPFDGMVDVEFISSENLVFPFPGIIAVYKAGNTFSLVHSAGRVKNSDEGYTPVRSEETNWSCKFGPGIVPFFHIFNGPERQTDDVVTVRWFGSKGIEKQKVDFHTGLFSPFSSRIVLLDELFDLSAAEPDCFFSVTLRNAEFFPRLVVGNLHKQNELLEVTHSFPVTTIADYVKEPPSPEHMLWSFLPMVTPAELELDLVSFPTNADAAVTGRVRRMREGDKGLYDTAELATWQTGPSAPLFHMRLAPDERLISLDFCGGAIPSRLNCSYRYRVRGTQAAYSTDMATGAKSWVYPPKHSHWGHGVLGGGFQTVIMLRNIAHDLRTRGPVKGSIQCFALGCESAPNRLEVAEEGALFLNARDFMPELAIGEKPRFFSWFIKMDKPNVETFFVAYAADGRICGEHGF